MSSESIYTIKTDIFEGPLDVLLSLIEKRKLHISDISLARVTDDYLQYIQNNIEHDLENSTLFLSIAATLVLIKSKLLLDNDIKDTEIKDASFELEMRLKILSLLRSGTESYIKSQTTSFVERSRRSALLKNIFLPHDTVNRDNLHIQMTDILHKLPKEKEKLQTVTVMRVMSLEQMIGKLKDTFKTLRSKTSFHTITDSLINEGMTYKEAKVSTIVSFLAILELVRSGYVEVEQTNTYEEIMCDGSYHVPVN